MPICKDSDMTSEVLENIRNRAKELDHPHHMMATKAYHLFPIHSSIPDLCYVTKETDNFYVGVWEFGIGMLDVVFPKATTRELTQEEVDKYTGTYTQLSNNPPQPFNLVLPK